MGIAEMSLHRTLIILTVFAWCAYINTAEAMNKVNCEKWVFHPNCRGMQAKKRFVNSAGNDRPDSDCPCRNSKRLQNNEIDSMTNSKLLEALFANGFDINTLYDAYAATSDRRRDYNLNRERPSRLAKSFKESSIDLGTSDMDEDY